MRQVALKTVADVIAGGPDGERAEALQSSSPARGLHDLAEREQADLIIVGSSERGALGRLTAGSTAHSLLSGAPCAVAVAPAGYAERPEQRLETIGVAYDGRPESDVALESAIDLARSAGARVHLVTLAYPPDRPFRGEGPAPVDVPAMLESVAEKMQPVQDAAAARIPDDVEHSGQVFADPQVALGARRGRRRDGHGLSQLRAPSACSARLAGTTGDELRAVAGDRGSPRRRRQLDADRGERPPPIDPPLDGWRNRCRRESLVALQGSGARPARNTQGAPPRTCLGGRRAGVR